MDSDTQKLLDWQQRVVDTMYEHAGNLQSPYAWITQSKWEELKKEAVEMQKRLQPRRWTVDVWEHKWDKRLMLAFNDDPMTESWERRARCEIVEGEGLEDG